MSLVGHCSNVDYDREYHVVMEVDNWCEVSGAPGCSTYGLPEMSVPRSGL